MFELPSCLKDQEPVIKEKKTKIKTRLAPIAPAIPEYSSSQIFLSHDFLKAFLTYDLEFHNQIFSIFKELRAFLHGCFA